MSKEAILRRKSAEQLRIVCRRRSSKFTKRRATILRKAHDLYKDCGVDVYIAIRNKRNNQMWQYSNGYIPPLTLSEVGIIHQLWQQPLIHVLTCG